MKILIATMHPESLSVTMKARKDLYERSGHIVVVAKPTNPSFPKSEEHILCWIDEAAEISDSDYFKNRT